MAKSHTSHRRTHCVRTDNVHAFRRQVRRIEEGCGACGDGTRGRGGSVAVVTISPSKTRSRRQQWRCGGARASHIVPLRRQPRERILGPRGLGGGRFLARILHLCPCPRGLARQCDRVGAIPPGCATRGRREGRVFAISWNYLASARSAFYATRPGKRASPKGALFTN